MDSETVSKLEQILEEHRLLEQQMYIMYLEQQELLRRLHCAESNVHKKKPKSAIWNPFRRHPTNVIGIE